MFKVDDSILDTTVADLLVADADALNAMVAGPDADSASVSTFRERFDVQPMSMGKSLRIRELDEF
jgi:hypothetical protein